jgi:CDP-glucose 4,6-dehydratase
MAEQPGKMEKVVTQQKQLKDLYTGKKVFVTGHTGFKGAWLLIILQELGAMVKGYALSPEYENGLFDTIQPLPGLQSVIADIRDKDRLQKEIEVFQPDYIFHLAAQPLVRRSYQIPAETFEVNVTGTANLLEAVHALKKTCSVVIITTDKVYENKEQHILYNEEDRLGGYDPYSASKACAELVVSSFRNSFFNPTTFNAHHKAIASARAGNVIGGGDWSADRIIPDIIRSLEKNNIIEIRNPAAIRPWQHVLEPLTGYLLLAALLSRDYIKYSKAFNFGPHPDDHLPVKSFVEKAIEAWGSGAWKDISDKTQPHEAGLLKLDIALAKKELDWHPKLKADHAIQWTIDWYRQPQNAKAEFTLQQIKTYLAL